MTAGRTNHTKFAAPTREEITFPEPIGDWGAVTHVNGLPLDYVRELREDRGQRQAWLTGSWDIHGDTRPDELRCTLCLRAGHAAADCPRAALLRGR